MEMVDLDSFGWHYFPALGRIIGTWRFLFHWPVTFFLVDIKRFLFRAYSSGKYCGGMHRRCFYESSATKRARKLPSRHPTGLKCLISFLKALIPLSWCDRADEFDAHLSLGTGGIHVPIAVE